MLLSNDDIEQKKQANAFRRTMFALAATTTAIFQNLNKNSSQKTLRIIIDIYNSVCDLAMTNIIKLIAHVRRKHAIDVAIW